MSAISTWVLSIVGIIILSILVDLILPSGKTSSFIKNIFGYLIIVVILSPVFTFFTNKEFSVNDLFDKENVQIQDGFVASVNRQFLDNAEKAIEKACEEEGFRFVEVGIDANIFESNLVINQISIDLKFVVIDDKAKNKNIKTSILDIVQDNIKIEKEIVVFYE